MGPSDGIVGRCGSIDLKGRIPEESADLEQADKVDITATVRHHENLQKSMR